MRSPRQRRKWWQIGFALTLGVCIASASAKSGATTAPAASQSTHAVDLSALRKAAAPLIERGLGYLAKAQAGDGGWEGVFGGSDPAITALAATAFIQSPEHGSNQPSVRRAVRFVLEHRHSDGGIYDPRIGYANYTTSIAVMLLAALDDPELKPVMTAARDYLKKLQWTEAHRDNEGDKITPDHPWYGGAGYGKHKRPDLSNTQMMVEALHASGLPKDDPAFKKAMRFITRAQMLDDSNDLAFARGAADGGFIYTPAKGGESKAGTVDVAGQPRLRSYGSMTYAGFKSMIYADLARDDRRVQAAWQWIQKHYTLDTNPNMPGEQSLQGLYYYYRVFAKALAAWGEPFITDDSGEKHNWRADLIAALRQRQKPDGSWVNEADRWHEGNPNLVTAYALLALQAALR